VRKFIHSAYKQQSLGTVASNNYGRISFAPSRLAPMTPGHTSRLQRSIHYVCWLLVPNSMALDLLHLPIWASWARARELERCLL